MTNPSSFVRASKDGLRLTRCPRCDVPMVRDLSAPGETYHCPNCATRWVLVVPPR